MPHLRRALEFLGYLYLLRVPLLTWALLIALWLGTFPNSFAEPILRGIFDIASKQSSVIATSAQFATVTLATLLACTSLGISARLVICNASARFRAVPVELSPGLELVFRLVPLCSFLAVIGTALIRSEAPWAGKLPGIVAGIVFWYLITAGGRRIVNSFHLGWISRFESGAWIPRSEPGYLDVERGTIQQRHIFATYQLVFALLAYVLYCVVSALDLAFLGGQFLVPSLSLAIMMLTLFCWGLGGIAFYIDRYRVPLLVPVVAFAFLSSRFPQSDYFYQGLAQTIHAQPLTSGDVIAAHLHGPDAQTPIVLVATTGGGIQSAAWTAQVLTGLNQSIPHFSRHIRLISAVSGGSVGAMYFTAAYQNGEVPASTGNLVDSAEQSSLDQVTWGLAYPDLLFGLLPAIKGIGVANGQIRTSDSGFIFMDRGRMLESSWRNRLPASQTDATLLSWEKDTAAGIRPAVIFNSTLVETGDRYLLSSSGFTKPAANQAKLEQYLGRWEFFKLYPNSDLRVVTAARLSATFPYVTPASRMLRNDSDKNADARFYRPEPHAVDGGYYDNYGMVSLLDWLNNGLQSDPSLKPKILIIEIRAYPVVTEARPSSSSYGVLFQLSNPLRTMANVRGTGQLSHNALDENLINHIYADQICEATFEFTNTDARGCPRNEPLNWHLTNDDKQAVENAWHSDSIGLNTAKVANFLSGGACPH